MAVGAFGLAPLLTDDHNTRQEDGQARVHSRVGGHHADSDNGLCADPERSSEQFWG